MGRCFFPFIKNKKKKKNIMFLTLVLQEYVFSKQNNFITLDHV